MRRSLILDPMRYFTDLYLAQKLDVLEAEVPKMVKDPRYRFFNFEEEFNNTGYNLLNRNQLEPAIYVFQLNTRLFPKSANAWDSLGEASWKASQKEKAIEYWITG